MDNLPSYLDFDLAELTLLGVFAVFFLLELFFYLFYYKAPLRFARKQQALEPSENENPSMPSVSVIITSSNASEHLEVNLPFILEQDYPDFEVIVVNNGSTDETDMVVKGLQTKYANLYGTYLPLSRDNIFGRKKLAITIGVKAAKKEALLFTESHCQPISRKWIASMMEQLTSDKSIVAGHSYFFEKPANFASRLIAFDNLMYCLQYMSMLVRRHPFSATFRNLAIRKKLFFDHKGFAAVLNYEHGEELFLNQIISPDNSSLCLSTEGYVKSILDDSEHFMWKGYRIAYQKIKRYFSGIGSWIFSIETFFRYAMLVVWGLILTKSILDFHFSVLAATCLLALALFFVQLSVINKTSKILMSGKFYLSWVILNLLQPFRNLYFRSQKSKTRNSIGSY